MTTRQPVTGLASFALRHGRPSAACRHAFWLPSAGLLVGVASSDIAALVVDALVPVVLLLVFTTVAGVEAKPPSRRDGVRALVILFCCSTVCPAVIWALLTAVETPPATCWAVTVAFAGPVSMGAGVVFTRLGQPARPAVWASLIGMMLCPLTLPAISAAADCGIALSPLALALNAALLGAAPAMAAFAWRNACPRLALQAQDDMRGLATIMLSVLAVAAGWRASVAFTGAGGMDLLGVILLSLGVAAVLGWAVGAAFATRLPDRLLAPMTMICSGMRNNSIAWAAVASAGALDDELESLFAVFVAIPSLVPLIVMVMVASACRAQSDRHEPTDDADPPFKRPGRADRESTVSRRPRTWAPVRAGTRKA